jgi:hypothetical protein
MAFAHPALIWTGLFWLRITTAVYYGFGVIVPLIVNDLTKQVMDAFYYADDAEVFKVNLITAFGVFTVLVTARILSRLFPRRPVEANYVRGSQELLFWGLLFGIIGIAVKYVFAVPYVFGLTGEILPGAVLQLSLLTSVGIYLVGSWTFTTAKGYIPLLTTFVALDILVGLATFSKTDVIFSLIMWLLAMMHAGVTIKRVVFALASGVIVFYGIVPVVEYGRVEVRGGGAGLVERVQIIKEYLTDPKDQGLGQFRGEFQSAAARLSYLNQSAFAVSLYDGGRPGNTLDAIAIVMIPRILWPEKPNLNFLTEGFNLAATDTDTSLSWPGQYVEAYWTLGWLGIPILMIPLGVIYFLLSRFAVTVFLMHNWAYFPVVLFGMRYGTEVGAPYATAVVGGLVFILAVYVGCLVLERSARLSRTNTRTHGGTTYRTIRSRLP